MKKTVFILLFSLTSLFALSQAKKPTIMVVPSDNWCFQHGFVQEFDNQGKTMKVPDYQKAFQENSDLLLVISKINELMADRGFPLKNLESVLRSMRSRSAEDNMMTSKTGSSISESPVDVLKKRANADIWIQLTWSVNKTGPKKSVTYNMQGIDAYTSKQIAGASGTGEPSMTAELPVLLEEATLAHLDNFNAQLQDHFDDLFENGREVVLNIKVWDSWGHDLESDEFGDDELTYLIEDWVADNTVKHRFSTSMVTENMMLFEQVRMPLYNSRGRATDARRWTRGLEKYLKTLGVTSKLTMRGLGEAQLILGEK